MNDLLIKLGEIGVIPVIKLEKPEQAKDLGHALLDGGLPCAEITFRAAGAEGAISTMASFFPKILVGAGTVLSVDQAQRALGAGARFIVSPGFAYKIVDWCLERDVPVIPGVSTPTEIMFGLDRGLEVLKFFPVETIGGPAALKAVSEVFSGIHFIPTGGVSAGNLSDYLRMRSVLAVGGSWMVKSDLIKDCRFDRIATLAHEASSMVAQVRTEGDQK
jgi:2-dehydro-3-deoxyphosphogluconate aldolase/(4S)-4-hydroxy-2-oxoglutarate aldolase